MKQEETGDFDVRVSALELIVVTALFAVISVFLIHFFVSAYSISNKADVLNNAKTRASATMELLKYFDVNEVAEEEGFEKRSEDTYSAYFDNEWADSSEVSADYEIRVIYNKSKAGVDGLYTAVVSAYNKRNNELIYELTDDIYKRK